MKTIKYNSNNTIIINKSKFITYAYCIFSENDAINILTNLRKEYNDANHICYSYKINNIIKSSDDKEPSGTAGVPIYNVINMLGLDMIMIVVIRYFGGIKLGAGGLIRAYNKCAKDVIANNTITNLYDGFIITYEFPYSNIKDIDYVLKGINIDNKEFNDLIVYKFKIRKDKYSKIKDLLSTLGKIKEEKSILIN